MSSDKKNSDVANKAMSGKPLFKRIALESVTALCVGFLLAFLWPKIVGEEFSTRSNARIYAPFLGERYGDGQREQTSVLLIDNAALADAGEAWPPQYSYHARLLRALARYRPRAVFLDIYFSQVRDDATLALLTKNLCALREQGTSVFLGVSSDATGDAGLRPELESLAGRCFQKVALQYTPDSLDRLAWTYPLENEEEKDAHGEPLPSAALAIYRDAFGRKLHVEDNELALTWGLRPATYGLRWLATPGKEEAHEDGGNRLYCRQDFGKLELAPTIVKNQLHHDAEKPVCVYHETLYANDLATSSEQEEAALKRLLEGKVVMIGAALSGGGDRILSPLHGRIPGVYLHAMALDNLLKFGDRYPRDIHLEWSTSSSHLKLYLFLFLSLFCGLILPKAFHVYWTDSRPTPLHWCVNRLRARWRRKWRPISNWLFGPKPKRKSKEKTAETTAEPPSRKEKCVGILRGCARTVAELLWIILKLAMAMAVVCVFVTIGQYCFSIGLMSTVDIVFFTFAAEWFELNEKLLKKLGMKKSED